MRRLFTAAAGTVEQKVPKTLRRADIVVEREGHALYALPLDGAANLDGASGWSEQARP
jgi:hypothetical protein